MPYSSVKGFKYILLVVPVRANSEISCLEGESPFTDIKHEKLGQNTNCIFNERLKKFDKTILRSDIVVLVSNHVLL